MRAKALAPLISALPKAPGDLHLDQKLAALPTRAGRFAEAGVCRRTLESIYHDAGHADEASRYADLAAKYEECSGTSSALEETGVTAATRGEPAATEFEVSASSHEAVDDTADAVQVATSSVAAPPAVPSGLFFHASATTGQATAAPAASSAVVPEAVVPQIAEFVAVPAPEESGVDLSNEWEQDLHVEAPSIAELSLPEAVAEDQQSDTREEDSAPAPAQVAPAVANLDESIEEVRFYLGQGMTDQAEQILVKLETLAPEVPDVALLRLAVESAKQARAPAQRKRGSSIHAACAG